MPSNPKLTVALLALVLALPGWAQHADASSTSSQPAAGGEAKATSEGVDLQWGLKIPMRDGVQLNQFYVQPVCSPTRSCLMTGRYAWRTRLQSGVLDNYVEPLIAKDRLTLPGLLREQGYHTACVGKWHLGRPSRGRDGLAAPSRVLEIDRPVVYRSGDVEILAFSSESICFLSPEKERAT